MRSNDTVVFVDSNEVALEERPVPDPGPGEVLVEAERSLISTGTELTQLSGDVPEGSVWDALSNYPIDTPGYCTAGEVVDVGDGVDDDAVGDRVATWQHHARYTVEDYDAVEPVPEGVTATEAAFTPIVQIVMNGVHRGEVDWGESVAIYGLGLLGQLATRFTRLAGARPVSALDLAEERIDYLPEDEEVQVVSQTTTQQKATLEPLFTGEDVLRFQEVVRKVPTAEDIVRYAVRLAAASRPRRDDAPEFINEWVNWGAGLRAAQFMVLGAKARALLRGAAHVSPDDIAALAKPALRHRVLVNYRAEAEGVDVDDVIDRLLQNVPQHVSR